MILHIIIWQLSSSVGFFFSNWYYKHDKADKKKPCSNDKVNGQLVLCPSSFYVQSNFLNPWILQLKYKTDHYLLKIYLPIIIANLINFHNKTNVGQWNESRTWSHISFVIKNFLPIFVSVIVITIKLKLIILKFHYLCKRLKIKIIN